MINKGAAGSKRPKQKNRPMAAKADTLALAVFIKRPQFEKNQRFGKISPGINMCQSLLGEVVCEKLIERDLIRRLDNTLLFPGTHRLFGEYPLPFSRKLLL